MQMSRHLLWIFVEGDVDVAFYSALLRANSVVDPQRCIVCRASELPFSGGGGGKAILIAFFRYLRSRSFLVMDSHGKRTAVAFLLDKDLDDRLRTKKRSNHIIYTDYYCVENYLFAYGDLAKSVSASACLDETAARNLIDTATSVWRRRAAESWKDWVVFCYFVRKAGLDGVPGYSLSLSRIHEAPYGPTVPSKVAEHTQLIERKAGLSSAQLSVELAKIASEVDVIYQRDRFDDVFNGKWYQAFIEEDAKKIAGAHGLRKRNGLMDRVISCLLITLDFRASWTTDYHNFFRRLWSTLSAQVTNKAQQETKAPIL